MKRIIWNIIFTLLLSSCSSIAVPLSTQFPSKLPNSTLVKPIVETQQPTIQNIIENTLMPPISTPNYPPNLENLINLAIQDLSKRLSVDPDQIKLIENFEMTWRNSGLDCGKSGGNYLQVITPGYLLRFLANDQEYEYHTDKISTVIFCSNPGIINPGTVDH